MDSDVQEAIGDVYKSRASKEAMVNLRRAFYWVMGIVAVAALSVAAGALATKGAYGETNERVAVIETQIASFAERQKENNGLLKEIERMLREGR